MDDDTSQQILTAIGALDEKFDRKFDELKKVDKDLTDEVGRLGQEQRAIRKDVDELRSETRRTFDAEREATKATNEAMVRHVNAASKAFNDKADDIDTIKKETLAQSETLKAILGSPTAKKVGAAVAALVVATCGWGVLRLQQSVQKLEEKPTTVQAAPTVYLPVYLPADGGSK